MHQYSAGKAKKVEDAILWFERCKIVLTDIVLLGEDKTDVQTPEISASKGKGLVYDDVEDSPTVQRKERISRLTDAISRLIDGDLNNPFRNEEDPFLSNNSTPQKEPTSKLLDKFGSQSPLTPSPLHIRKRFSMSPASHVGMLPSPALRFNRSVSVETECRDQVVSSMASTPDQHGGLRTLASVMKDMSDWESETGNSTISRGQDIRYLDDYRASPTRSRYSPSVDGRDLLSNQATRDDRDAREASIEAIKERLRGEIEGRVAQRMQKHEEHILVNTSSIVASSEMHNTTSSPPTSPSPNNTKVKAKEIPRSLSDLIRDYLGPEGNEKVKAFSPRPIPHSSSAKPLPLCPKSKTSVKIVSGSDSDKASLARLMHSWEGASFNGVYMVGSDYHSLHLVERTRPQLREKYGPSNKDLEGHIARFENHLSSFLGSLQYNIINLRQLANEIKTNRAQYLQIQKMPPSKSYWSFSSLSQDAMDETAVGDGDDNEGRKNSTVNYLKPNPGWAAPGTELNETKEARIKRLKEDGFQAVGLRNEKRGYKGDEYYSNLCDEALRGFQSL
ncbi:conserved hypothetical protein [Talaromyces stipitatus ATCC 10500]|uniref:Uncharacterized protein n=1 Tax=Talaromyces stipitatus (strain ATCC 10500 / CBS 375.48 / QM 6759 / NRRL 1006) TaxID=441959 RepID=B8MRR7_TALSN|nr:uncharacterized protein TSTA_057190 [Talaromyces stipitatus ATCC 10500]EED13224.1 conserved hypothetical protein [Talaromyces stipitatus ATCC 10500]